MNLDLDFELDEVIRDENATFDELIGAIEVATEAMKAYRDLRDRAIVAADRIGPYADRTAIGRAAGLKPSSLYRLLARAGRPSNRRKQSRG